MISGSSAVTPLATIRASGWMPSAFAALLAHHDDGRGAVVERARVAGGDAPVGAEHRLQTGETLERGAGPRAVVLGDDLAVGRGDGRDLTLEEPVLLRLDRAVLRQARELVHLLACHVAVVGDVLGGLAHRDVDVGEAFGRRPLRHAAVAAGHAALARPENFGLWVPGRPSDDPFANRLTVSTPPEMNTCTAMG